MNETESNEKLPAIKQGWLRALLMLLAFLLGTLIFGGIAAVVIAMATGTSLMELQTIMENPDKLGILIITQLVSMFVAFGVIWIFRRYIDRKSIGSMGFQLKGKTMDLVYGFLVGFVLMLVGFLILKLVNNLEVVAIAYDSEVVWGGFFLFLIVAVIEEVIFRGYVLNNLMESFKNKYLALFISSLVFAIFHGLNPNLSLLGFVNLIVAGMALGITYMHTKNLWFPIFLHLSWNFFQGPIFGFEVSGLKLNSVIQQKVIGSDLITGGDFGFEGSILITVLLVIMIIVADRLIIEKA